MDDQNGNGIPSVKIMPLITWGLNIIVTIGFTVVMYWVSHQDRRIETLENTNAVRGERIAAMESKMPTLDRDHDRLERRVDRLEERVKREIPN